MEENKKNELELGKSKDLDKAEEIEKSGKLKIFYGRQFSGPLPPPEILESYEKTLPGAADRIFTMAEKEQEHRQKIENNMVEDDNKNRKAGRRSSTFLMCLIIITGAILSMYDKKIMPIASLITVLGLAIGPLFFENWKNDDTENKDGESE